MISGKIPKILLSLLLLLLAGCAVKSPPVSTYVLTIPPAVFAFQPSQTNAVLLISAMTADPGYKTSQMIYLKEPAHLREYSRNAWVAPPAQMFMPLLIESIESKNYFRAVTAPPFAGHSDYRLDTRLILLQQEFLQPQSQVRCIVEALLTNNYTGRVIVSHRFQAVVPALGNNPASGAAAANQAAHLLSEEIAQFTVANARGK
jgi:cholesterol transport system auxiliary component